MSKSDFVVTSGKSTTIHYEHRLIDSFGLCKPGELLASTETNKKLNQYTVPIGLEYIEVPINKVSVFEVLTETIVTRTAREI